MLATKAVREAASMIVFMSLLSDMVNREAKFVFLNEKFSESSPANSAEMRFQTVLMTFTNRIQSSPIPKISAVLIKT